jgi:hypothetical protein
MNLPHNPMRRVFVIVPMVLALAVLLARTEAAAAPASGITVSLESRGVAIKTPLDGQFLLAYPALMDAAQKPTQPTGVSVTRNTASMRYANGAQLAATLENGAIMLHFTTLPDTAKGMRMEMPLPASFQNGGQWQMDESKPQPWRPGVT